MARIVIAAVAISIALGGCGDSDPAEAPSNLASGSELAAAFGKLAEKAYAANDLDRDEDYAQGTTVDGCFFLDQRAAEAIADAIGGGHDKTEVAKDNLINGPPEQAETLVCTLSDPEEEDLASRLIATVGAGTTTLEPEQYVEQALRLGKGEEIEGDAEGLDPDDVVAFERANVLTFAWISDDFVIGLSAPTRILSVEDGFAALPTVVDEVSRTLLGGGA
jgi:hypothetical protein